MKRLSRKLFAAMLALVMIFALSATAFADGEEAADMPADGMYKIDVDTGEKMFKVVDAVLKVENGNMTAVLTLSGKGYSYLYAGAVSADDTDDLDKVAEKDRIPYVENEQGQYTYEVPVAALDQPLDFGSFSTKNQVWYDRHMTFKADTLTYIEALEGEEPPSPAQTPDNTDVQDTAQPAEAKAKNVPKTSDESQLAAMAALLILSAGAAIALKKKTA